MTKVGLIQTTHYENNDKAIENISKLVVKPANASGITSSSCDINWIIT